jgi:hypothetical protein
MVILFHEKNGFLKLANQKALISAVLRIRIRDPVPFFTPGSGSGRNNPDHISESLETIFLA